MTPFNPMTVESITFDAAHTLFHPYPSVGAVYREVMLIHGIDLPVDQLEAGFRQAFATTHKDLAILDGEARERSYWRHVVAASMRELAPSDEAFDALFNDLWEEFAKGSRWRPCPGAKEALAELRQRGYTLALLTNWDGRVRQVLRETGFEPLFHHLFVSSEIGAEKPDPAIFAAAESILATPAQRILHVGDSLQHDMAGAWAAGWQALRVQADEYVESDRSTIRRVADLPSLLPASATR